MRPLCPQLAEAFKQLGVSGGEKLSGVDVLRGKHLALVGDSLTRQMFESLSCALNLTSRWYYGKAPFLEALVSDKGKETGVLKLIKGSGGGTNPTHIGVSASSFGKEMQAGKPPGAETGFHITYYNLFRFERKMLPFVLNQPYDFIVVNLGVHYNPHNGELAPEGDYAKDLEQLFKQMGNCSRINRCFFRDTLQQHFVYDTVQSRLHFDKISLELLNTYRGSGMYLYPQKAARATEKHCGNVTQPFPYTEISRRLANVHGIQSIPAQTFRLLHRFHPRIGDCTHFCQDPYIWNLMHRNMLHTLRASTG